MSKRKISCFCENEWEVEVPESVDLDEEPGREGEILEGTFLSYRCDRCGKVLKPEFPMRVVSANRGLELFLLPELERGPFSLGKADYKLDDTVRGRVVIGYPELVEKIKIARDGLDDRVIEIMKFYLLEKAEADESVRAYYYAKPADSIELHIYGMREDEVGVSKVPLRVYEQISGELEQKTNEEFFAPILEPPYVSIQKTYREAPE